MNSWAHKLSVKPEAGDKIEMDLTVNLEGLNLDPFTLRGLKDFAANEAKVVRDGKMNAATFVAGFQQAVTDYANGVKKTREGGGGITVDSRETLANRLMATKFLKVKYEADKDFASKIGITVPVVTDKKGNPNFLGWAKAIRAAQPDLKACQASLRDADAANLKGYE